MFVVWAAWLYVIGMLALGAPSALRGIALFAVVGLGPVLLMAWFAALRARRRNLSVGDELPDQPDREDPQADQQHLLDRGAQIHAPVQSRDQVGHRDIDHARRDKSQ